MKNKYLLLLGLSIFCAMSAFSQTKLIAKNGNVTINSSTPVESFNAVNKQVVSALMPATGDIVVQMLNKSFHFERALMEEHFNENYMESPKFPRSEFSGKITNLSEVKFNQNGTYQAKIEGILTVHGVKKPIKQQATITVADGKPTLTGKFNVTPQDFGIKIPSVVSDKIAKTVEIVVNISYK